MARKVEKHVSKMKNILRFEPLTPKTYNDYIKVGTLAYNQHYLHLWPNGDSTPYITNSFTFEILQKEEQNKNTHLYTIKLKNLTCIRKKKRYTLTKFIF